MGTLFQLVNNTILPHAGSKIIKQNEYAILLEASELLNIAKQQAEAIVGDAQKIYEEKKAQGYEDGLSEGKMEHAEKMMETVLSSLEFIESIEHTVVDVVNQAIRKVIGELDDDERIVRIVRTALQTVRNQQKIVIRVAVADEPAVRKALDAMLINIPNSPSVLNLIPDTRLSRGACILESELGVVDASLEVQLQALEHAFKAKIIQ